MVGKVCKHSLVLLVVVAVSGKTLKWKIRRAKFSCSEVISSQSYIELEFREQSS